jgi:hypothetical protein
MSTCLVKFIGKEGDNSKFRNVVFDSENLNVVEVQKLKIRKCSNLAQSPIFHQFMFQARIE